MPTLKRHILNDEQQKKTVDILQDCLFTVVDLALQGKQAHWNVVGTNFRSLHLQLDDIIGSARQASDAIAERIVTLATSPDGRASIVGEKSKLMDYPRGLKSVPETVTLIADRLTTTITGMRKAIETLDELDLVSQDLLIQTSADLEKHLWMVQAQEVAE